MTTRLISQNKALHCYLLLSLWILLVIAGLYKFLEWDQDGVVKTHEVAFNTIGVEEVNRKNIFRLCNFPENIQEGDEGILDKKKWSVKGLIVLIRHGDRGPLQHVKKISRINCNTPKTEVLQSYKAICPQAYLNNLTATGKIQWTGSGPFHGFPVLPKDPNMCLLGQLTMQGVSQHLNLGQTLRNSYREVWPKLEHLKPEEVLVYSTRYRRTFQSGLAFLYGLIPSETLTGVRIRESHSMSFCFKDCECPITEKLKKLTYRHMWSVTNFFPDLHSLSQYVGEAILSLSDEALVTEPSVVRDALLAYICHRSATPCESADNCIGEHHTEAVLSYAEWLGLQRRENVYWRTLCQLRSYGQIKHIVQQMLHMVGTNGPNMVLYSGHDYTVYQLTTALGLKHDPLIIQYASRIIFEVYQETGGESGEEKGIYFRVLANGKDVTKQMVFCANTIKIDDKNALCKVEDIVRFLHDDYFSALNVTNFKDACMLKSDRENAESDLVQIK